MLPHVTIYNEIGIDGRMHWLPATPSAPFQYYKLGFRLQVDTILMGGATAFHPAEQEAEADAVELPKPANMARRPAGPSRGCVSSVD